MRGGRTRVQLGWWVIPRQFYGTEKGGRVSVRTRGHTGGYRRALVSSFRPELSSTAEEGLLPRGTSPARKGLSPAAKLFTPFAFEEIRDLSIRTELPTLRRMDDEEASGATSRRNGWFATLERTRRGRTPRRMVRSKIRRVTGLCGSRELSHLAALFIDRGTEVSIAKSCVLLR